MSKVISEIIEIEKPKNTYNLHVKDNHNYYAAGINV
jgi:intein/homing endonuclease